MSIRRCRIFCERLGIRVYKGYRAENLIASKPDIVVIGNALSRGNPEVEYTLDSGLRYASMAETVKELFIRGKNSIVVSGTHGKTTTTAMLSWVLEQAGRKPSFLVGGIAENFGRSFQVADGPDFVIEGDEYDTAFFDKGPKFLHYLPRIVLLKNIEFDHADIYADLEALKTSFRRLINIVPRSGLDCCGGGQSGRAGIDSGRILSRGDGGNRVRRLARDEIFVQADEGMRFEVSNGSTCSRHVRYPDAGNLQRAKRSRRDCDCEGVGIEQRCDPVGPVFVQEREAAAGTEGGSESNPCLRRFCPPSHGSRRNVERCAATLSAGSNLGGLRTAIAHVPEENLRERLHEGVRSGGRRW